MGSVQKWERPEELKDKADQYEPCTFCEFRPPRQQRFGQGIKPGRAICFNFSGARTFLLVHLFSALLYRLLKTLSLDRFPFVHMRYVDTTHKGDGIYRFQQTIKISF